MRKNEDLTAKDFAYFAMSVLTKKPNIIEHFFITSN